MESSVILISSGLITELTIFLQVLCIVCLILNVIWMALFFLQVVDAGARSLRMIYQSKLAPKYDFLQEKNMEFLLSLLNSENENVTGLGASIITHSCETSAEQNALCDAGVLKKLIGLLQGSLSQRDASLESIATVIKSNPEVVSKFVGPENGREWGGERLISGSNGNAYCHCKV